MIQRPRRALFLAAIAVAVLVEGASALACPKPTAADYVGYWRYAGSTPLMGSFQPAKENSGIEFRDGVKYYYQNGQKTDSPSNYEMKNGELTVAGFFSTSYFFATCNRNELSESSFLTIGTYRRAKRP